MLGQHGYDVVGLDTRYLNDFVWEVFTKFFLELVKATEDRVPIDIRLFTSLLTMSLVVGEDVLAPVVLVVTSDDHVTVVLVLGLDRADRI